MVFREKVAAVALSVSMECSTLGGSPLLPGDLRKRVDLGLRPVGAPALH
jgi:hypothetical protein